MSRLLFYSVPLAAAGISSWRWYLQPPQPPEPPPAISEPVYIPSRFPPLEATDDTAISRPPSVLELHARPLARMRTGDEYQRREAAAMLSQAHGLTEPDCRQLGQTLDHRTALLLANWTSTDLRMFLPPRGVSAAADSAPPLELRLRLLLESLPPGAPCAEFWRARALRHPPLSDWDPAPLAADAAELGAPAPWRSASSSAVEADCLRALRERADSPPQCRAMLAAGALDLLAAAHAQKPRDAARCGVIAQILGGFDSAQLLHQAGWLGVLAAWSREKDIRVGPGAWRVIRNLIIEERLLGTSKTTSGVGDSGRRDDHEMRKGDTGGSKRAKTGNDASDEARDSNLAEKNSKLSEDSSKTNVTTTTTTSGTTITHEPDDPVASALVSLDLRLAALRSRISSFLSSLGLPSLPSTPPPSPRVLRPLPDGVLVLHPRSISAEEKTEVDIVFVHGLLGGTERTWRQADSAKGELLPPPEPRLSEIVMRIHGEEGRSVDKGDREESQKSGEDVAKAGGDVTRRSSDIVDRSSDVIGENHVSDRSRETMVTDSNQNIDSSTNGKERVNRKNGVMDSNISKSDISPKISTGRSVGKGQAVSEINTSSSNNTSDSSSNIASTTATTTAIIASNGSTARSTSSTAFSTAFSTSTMTSTHSTSYSTSTASSFFTSSPDQEPYTQCWPRDWLPSSLHPLKVRILSVDYDSAWSDWRPRCAARRSRTLAERAADLRKLLEDAGVGDRPIVWVTHSMGGLLVKKMLVDVEKEVERGDGERGEGMVERVRREERVKGGKDEVRAGGTDVKTGDRETKDSSTSNSDVQRGDLNHPLTTNTNLPGSPSSPLSPLLSSTLGVVFLSCPHTGSALATSVSGPLYPLLLPSTELHSLCRHSPPLLQLREEFVSLCLKRGTPCLSVAETLPQPLLGRKVRFVEADSADAGVGEVVEVAENHLGVCKPRDRKSEVYKLVVDFVKQVCAGL
ncbi:uncharacterized protein LOC122367629 [Amphibalanus amphitrite]|uniref:uncharacterized protein LOC122367629 n=1 Tax=Amphibalanus amphitrite TaxID=1232801 RepID=UPI001C929F5A|nr:uncharacterized protein LOC122367629 [Amphibalanus amphitrite]